MKLREMLEETWSVPTHIGKQHMTMLTYKEATEQVFSREMRCTLSNMIGLMKLRAASIRGYKSIRGEPTIINSRMVLRFRIVMPNKSVDITSGK